MKVPVEINCDNELYTEVKRLAEDFCYSLQEDISSDISFIIGEEVDDVSK